MMDNCFSRSDRACKASINHTTDELNYDIMQQELPEANQRARRSARGKT